jgi:hypothetical protein
LTPLLPPTDAPSLAAGRPMICCQAACYLTAKIQHLTCGAVPDHWTLRILVG